jgi:hypothetical protein
MVIWSFLPFVTRSHFTAKGQYGYLKNCLVTSYVDSVFILAEHIAFSKGPFSMILSCQDLSIPKGKKNTTRNI